MVVVGKILNGCWKTGFLEEESAFQKLIYILPFSLVSMILGRHQKHKDIKLPDAL